MAKYKNGKPWEEDIFNEGSYGHHMYWEKYYDNPGYFYRTAPNFAVHYPAVGRRSQDQSSSDLDPSDLKQSSSVRKSRIAIIVTVFVTICAITAAIFVAVYFTSIPDKRSESEAIIRKVEVTRLKIYQGEVGLMKEWNENLTDPASSVYKQEANNFISAMDQIYGNSPDKDRYNGTVVDGFRSGSTFVKCRIFWTGIYIQEIDSSAILHNEQKEQVISEVEINPVDTENMIKLIKDQLPDLLGLSLKSIQVLQVVMTTIAPVTTGKPATTAPIAVKSTTSTQEPLNQMASQPTTTNAIANKKRTITVKSTPTTLMSRSTTTPTTPKTSNKTNTTPTSTSTSLNSTVYIKATITPQLTTVLTSSKSTTAITTSNQTSSSTATPHPSTISTTTLKSTTARTKTSISSTTTRPNPTFASTETAKPSITIITKSKPVMTRVTISPKPAVKSRLTTSKPTTTRTTPSTLSNTTTTKPVRNSMTPNPAITSSRTQSGLATTSTRRTQIPGTTSATTVPRSTISSTKTTPKPGTTMRPELKTASNITERLAGSVACQFEDAYKCGYRNLQPNALWDQRSGNFFKLPPYDHTYGNDTGKFMVAYNNSDLQIYYNKIEYPYRIEYLSAILSSPKENFLTESCVYFYYYLNGTAVRPNPLSAQLYVYVNGSKGRQLEWYDHVNRTSNGWLKGWVSVQPGHANVIFEAKTVTTTTVWPGVVALDDVSVSTGSCPAHPGCGPDTFRCTTTRVCISVDLQCDGGNDCVDGSDEENCKSKPDYQVKLINGDGSYGSIAIFYHGLWRPVCMPKTSLMEGNSTIVQLACKKIGYTGRFQGAFANSRGGFVNSWHHPVKFAIEVSCKYKNVDISNCSMHLTQTTENTSSCYYYQAAFCSNNECFSGERLCPKDHTNTNHSSSAKCISKSYFCDGIPDCLGGTDELNCVDGLQRELGVDVHSGKTSTSITFRILSIETTRITSVIECLIQIDMSVSVQVTSKAKVCHKWYVTVTTEDGSNADHGVMDSGFPANCSANEFECTNHKCVPASQRCDGTPHCRDKSDEYGCVIVTNNRSQIYHSHLSAYLPVCYNNISSILANILCSLSGQGSSTHYQPFTYGQGTVLTAHSNATTSLVPGYTISIEPCFSLLLQCSSIECGTTLLDDNRLTKIFHGRDAVLGHLPWQIALYADENFLCGGSIIHPNWVLTAAHCTKDKISYSVRVGAVEIGPYISDDYQGQLYSSSRTHIHPYYNTNYDSDISLLYFSQPIVFNDYVRPICIASRKTVEEMLNAGYNAECYVSGWGNNHNYINGELWMGKLQMVRVQLYKKEECDQNYYTVYKMYPQNTTVCVDNQNFGAPTCSGDSGGPLICRNKYGRFELLGTLSWGYPTCFEDGYPDIYQLSYPHASWMEQITGLAFSDLSMDMD